LNIEWDGILKYFGIEKGNQPYCARQYKCMMFGENNLLIDPIFHIFLLSTIALSKLKALNRQQNQFGWLKKMWKLLVVK
jgi:hypothetical protein